MALDHPFARAFAEAWSKPTADGLVALLTPDVVLRQPHRSAIHGRDAARAELARMLRWLPELHGEDFEAEGSADRVFIEWTLVFPVRRGGLRVHAVDRFTLRDGLGAERWVFFDQMPLLLAVGLRPWAWPGFLRYRFG
ncbi:SnoaL-like protein [Panacagrimonas perspica]|uniref:SnoaL-like protein n=1 Tax=Panacagrimonas perspica TaxID=381431 RepID=A0A4R7PD80_9GAMM|nr:nuclear transport factor 2 family protein [Panacagrimonas perspica]TDU32093.1 SnoaL-like protein [Panacagrimonas perspica]THD01321.1 hypothetical protein B1810_20260 [Panacagrimonas perspica]